MITARAAARRTLTPAQLERRTERHNATVEAKRLTIQRKTIRRTYMVEGWRCA